MGMITAVISGKGGAGKTTITAALGCELAKMGQKCVLVDADLGLRSLDAVLGLQNHVTYDLLDAALGLCSLREALIRDSLHPGLYLLPAPRGQDQMDRWSMMELCASLREQFDQVLLDAPAGIGEGMRRVIGTADRALLVTLPEVTAVRGAAQALKRVQDNQTPAGLIINRYHALSALLGHSMDSETVREVLALPLYGVVPEDSAVRRLQGQCRPVSDAKSAAARAVRRIAQMLMEDGAPPDNRQFPHGRGRRRNLWETEKQEQWNGSPF